MQMRTFLWIYAAAVGFGWLVFAGCNFRVEFLVQVICGNEKLEEGELCDTNGGQVLLAEGQDCLSMGM